MFVYFFNNNDKKSANRQNINKHNRQLTYGKHWTNNNNVDNNHTQKIPTLMRFIFLKKSVPKFHGY